MDRDEGATGNWGGDEARGECRDLRHRVKELEYALEQAQEEMRVQAASNRALRAKLVEVGRGEDALKWERRARMAASKWLEITWDLHDAAAAEDAALEGK